MRNLMITSPKLIGVFLAIAFFAFSGHSQQQFQYPVNGSNVQPNCYFGNSCASATKKHSGVDFTDQVNGTEIIATADGRIHTLIPLNSNEHGMGNTVIIQHRLYNGLVRYSMYSHLQYYYGSLSVGDVVKRGQTIGKMGASGYSCLTYWCNTNCTASTGCSNTHLHFEIKNEGVLNNPSGQGLHWGYTTNYPTGYGYQDPLYYMNNSSITVIPQPDPISPINTTLNSSVVNVNWQSVSGAAVYRIQIKKSGNSGWTAENGFTESNSTSSSIPVNSTSSSSNKLVNLSPNTLYYYTIKVANSQAESFYSKPVWFKTGSGGSGSCPDSYFEPNQSWTSANTSAFPTIMQGASYSKTQQALISSATDKDYYQIRLSDPGQLKVTMYSLPKDYDLKLLNASGSTLAQSTAGGTSIESITYNYSSTSTSNFYIYGYGYNGNFDCQDTYQLKVEWTPSGGTGGGFCPDSYYEPNQSQSQANTSAFPTIFSTSSSSPYIYALISSSTDKDYYRIRTTDKGAFRIVLSSLPKDYDLRIYGPNGYLGGSTSNGTESETVEFNINSTSTQSYYIQIYGKNGANHCSNTYKLQVEWTPLGGGGSGNNDYCSSAGTNTNYEWIQNVLLYGHWQANSGNNGGYVEYNATGYPITTGSKTIKLTPGFSNQSYNEYWRVWIDFNKDGAFSNTERVVSASGSSAITKSFTIPSYATGVTKMRISMKYDGYPDACETFGDGEVEDYIISINGGAALVDHDQEFEYTSERNLEIDISNANFTTEKTNDMNWGIFPNPVRAENMLNISLDAMPVDNDHPLIFRIFDLSGRLVYSKSIIWDRMAFQEISLPAELHAGVYICTLGELGAGKKLVVQ